MTTHPADIVISPVNMEDRASIDIKSGDTVRVWIKVEEKGKTRLQPFEGLVLARKHGNEPGATFTVRRVAGGYGVEKIFPLYSPSIDKIELIKRAKVRRSKLYHIREKVAREIKRQMRNMHFVDIQTKSDTEEQVKQKVAAEKKEAQAKEEVEAQVSDESKVAEAPVASEESKEVENTEAKVEAPASEKEEWAKEVKSTEETAKKAE